MFRTHFRAFAIFVGAQIALGLALIPVMRPLLLLQQGSPQDPFGPIIQLAPTWALVMGVSLVFASIANALLIRYLGDVLEQRSRPMPGFVRAALSRSVPLFVVTVLAGVALVVGLTACIVPGVLLGVGFAIAQPAVVLKRVGPIGALALSWRWTGGQRMNVALVVLIGILVVGAASMVNSMGSAVVPKLGTFGMIVYTLVTYTFNGAAGAFFQALIVVLFFHLQQRALAHDRRAVPESH